MFSDLELILTVPPEGAKPTQANGLTPAHMAYRVGDGPHLFRAALPTANRGGYMVIDDVGFNGLGEATPLCHEILRECTARGFTGVICDFEAKPFQVLVRAVAQLGELLEKRGWPLLVPEAYAHASDKARVLVSSALSGGSLKQKLADAVERYGQSRVVLAVERMGLGPSHPRGAGGADGGPGPLGLFLRRAVRPLLHLYVEAERRPLHPLRRRGQHPQKALHRPQPGHHRRRTGLAPGG